MPVMILEIITAFLMTSLFFKTNSSYVYNVNFIAVLLIWGSTFFLSVPCHSKLNLGYQKEVIEKLVSTNWVRTLLWTARSFFWAWFFVSHMELSI